MKHSQNLSPFQILGVLIVLSSVIFSQYAGHSGLTINFPRFRTLIREYYY